MSGILSRLVVKPQLARVRQPIQLPQTLRAARPLQTPTPVRPKTPQAAPQARYAPPAPVPTTPKPAKAAPPVQNNGTPVARLPAPVSGPAAARMGLQAVVKQPRSLKRQEKKRNKGVKYITADVSGYEQEKIRNIRNRGNGRILLIIGNGPSISEAPLDLLRGHPNIDAMSINKPDDRLWPTAYWAYFDQSQQRRHQSMIDSYRGVIFNSTSIKQQRDNSIKVKNLGGTGFSIDLMRGMHIGRSSVYAAMQIGLWMDYRHIYIFGCDMCEVGGKTHFYGVNPDAPPETRLSRFGKEAEYYADAADRLDEETRKRFTFCSAYNPYGFVEKFGRMDHREAVPRILEAANNILR